MCKLKTADQFQNQEPNLILRSHFAHRCKQHISTCGASLHVHVHVHAVSSPCRPNNENHFFTAVSINDEKHAMQDYCLGFGNLHPSFLGCRQSFGMVKLAKRTVPYSVLNPQNLDVEQLTLLKNTNSLNINQACNCRKHSQSYM